MAVACMLAQAQDIVAPQPQLLRYNPPSTQALGLCSHKLDWFGGVITSG